MVSSISILGSTGSIGTQAVEISRRLGIRVRAITGNRNIKLLEEQARALRPELICVCDEKSAAELKIALADTGVKVLGGEESLVDAAEVEGADCVVTAVSGSVGLRPTLAAIERGRRIALANKETLVCAGALVMKKAREKGASIIPVDSEHSAVFQCLEGRDENELERILLTASGGPFRGMKKSETYDKTPEQALRHPNWSMGAKITVDSATMMNKGLEVIEAMHLFGVGADDIRVLIHPQSIVHSAVELTDGSVIAQLGVPDMALPIQYALTYPERKKSQTPAPDFFNIGALTFEEPDLEELPCLALAFSCAKAGGTAPCVMSAANEVAVSLFLDKKISFGRIYECVQNALNSIDIVKEPTLNDILEADAQAKEYLRRKFD